MRNEDPLDLSGAQRRRALGAAGAAAIMRACGASAGLLAGRVAYAQEGDRGYPSRVIRLSVGGAAGGSGDLVIRPLIQQMSPRLGQPIVMEYRPGANQAISTAYVAKAPPDGHTIGFVTDAIVSLAPVLPAPLPFDARNDFTMIGVMQYVSLVLVASRASGIVGIPDLIARARANPGKLSYASLSVGSIAHIAMEVFAMDNGIELLHVPYKGAADAIAATASGEVDMTLISIGVTLPFIPSRVRPLALASSQRHPRIPDVPTFPEIGHKDFVVRAWFGLVVPRATPAPIVARLRDEIWRVVSSDSFVRETLIPTGAEAPGVAPERLDGFLEADQDKWREWVRRLGPRLKLT